MVMRRGISVLDLLDVPPGSQAVLPANIVSAFDRLTVIDHRSTVSASAYIHHGTLLADETLSLPLGIQVPGVNTGLPFQLTLFRATAGSGQNLEPASSSLQLDLILSRVAIQIPGLRPARFVAADAARPASLAPDLSRSMVRIAGSGVLRIRVAGSAVDLLFIDAPDPIDINAPTGAVAGLTFDPPHFFIGNSEFGLTVDRLTFDLSDTFTPADIAARGHDAAWEGIVIREATLYLPPGAPLLGDISVGVRDVILGKPAGIQGELRLEFGHVVVPTFQPTFNRLPATGAPAALTVEGTDRARTVRIPSDAAQTRVRAELSGGATARWFPPGAASVDGARVEFDVRRGDVLRAQPLADGQATAEVLFTFRPDAAATAGAAALAAPAPTIQVERNVTPASGPAQHNVYSDVASISGAPDQLRFLTFRAVRGSPPLGRIDWRIDGVPNSATSGASDGTYSSAAASFPSGPGVHQLVLTEYATAGTQTIERKRRVQIEVRAEGSLLIGARDGIHDARSDIANVIPHTPLHTYDLGAFEERGELLPAEGTLTQSGPTLSAPAGTLVEVLVDEPGSAAPSSAPDPRTAQANALRWSFVEMATQSVDPVNPGTLDAVRQRLLALSGAKYLVVGRTDDLWAGAPPYLSPRALDQNRDLAQTRADNFAAIVRQWIGSAAQVEAVGEQNDAPQSAGFTPADPPVPAPQPAPLVNPYGLPGLTASRPDRFMIRRLNSALDGTEGRDIPERVHARRVDIFTIGGTPAATTSDGTAPATEGNRASGDRHLLVPGNDLAERTPPPQRTRRRDEVKTAQYRVRIRVVWDSPTAVSPADAIPTLAEVTVAWPMGQVPLPPVPGIPSGSTAQVLHGDGTPATATEIWTLVGQWSTDPRSGETVFALSLNSTGDPDGLFKIGSSDQNTSNVVNGIVSTAFLLAPAFIAGAQTDTGSPGVRIAELLIASAVAAVVAKNGKVVFHGFRIEHRQRSLTDFEHGAFTIFVDYSAEVVVDATRLGLPVGARTRTRGVRVRYKNVGLIIDHTPADPATPREWYERIQVVYDEASFEVENPGDWEIDGPLGQLLRVTASRAGSSSTWLELDLVFALDLGVVTITGATIRLTLTGSTWSFELRGLGVRVRIEGVLIGEGRLQVGNGGDFSASIDVLIIPMKVQARATMRYQHPDFFFLDFGVTFPTGIPVAPGLAAFGFIGRFVSNGSRVLPAEPDPIRRELTWYKETLPENKYGPRRGQWAIGLGAVVGTLPDGAYTFNATGMLVVEFPDPSVVLGVEAFLLKERQLPSGGGGGTAPSTTSFNITGLIVVDANAVKVGVLARYEIPSTLRVNVPIGAYFPFHSSDSDASFVRIGADNAGTPQRLGDPVTLMLLPGTLNVSAWAFFMIEERQLHQLGGDNALNLDGFSIGLGVGAALEWGPPAVHLSASLSLLIGLGTKPFLLVGRLRINGELRLVVVSISASAELTLTVRDVGGGSVVVHLEGELCGKVDFFFFSVSGCVRFAIGDAIGDAPPAPPPLTGIDLVDRRAILMGHATPDLAPISHDSDIAANNTVWPDTIPVLKFAHFLEQHLAPASQFSQLAPPVPTSRWWGSDQLKYAYRLTEVKLAEVPASGPTIPVAGTLDASWWLPASRPGLASTAPDDPQPSQHEGRDLALLTWHPALWARNLGPDGGALPGDPANTIGRGCSPSPNPQRNCAQGSSGKRKGPDLVIFHPAAPTKPPFPNWFEVDGRETLKSMTASQVALTAAASGKTFVAGTVVALEETKESVYRIAFQHVSGAFDGTLQFDGTFAPSLESADITLVVCPEGTPAQVCDSYSDLVSAGPGGSGPRSFGPNFGHKGFLYETKDAAGVHTVVAGLHVTLGLGTRPMQITLPELASSALVVLEGAPQSARVEARDDANTLVATGAPAGPAKTMTIAVTAPRIKTLTISANASAQLAQVCYTPLQAKLDPRFLPAVLGIDDSGNLVPWNVVETVPLVAGGRCLRLRYAPQKDQPWTGVRIDPYFSGRVHIASICGISSAAAQAARDDNQARATLVADLRSRTSFPTRQTLLDPGKTYQITVSWQSQTWQRSDGQPQPPAIPPEGAWSSAPAVHYHFAVASEAPLPASAPPPALITEDSFDARGVTRYVLGFVPGDGVDVPHFLDDSVSIHFSVDHLQALFAKYGRTMDIRVVHTNPPAGSRHGVIVAPPLPSTFNIVPSAQLLGDADRRMADAAARAGCVTMPSTGGSRADVNVTLLPNAEYDVVLVAAKAGADVVVGRAHFRTSRYRNARGLLDALGFTTAAGPFPYDFIVDAAATIPPGTALGSDVAFEAALRALGMDPWPQTTQPRVTAIWKNAGGVWRAMALLVESLEPLQRDARLPHVPLFAGAPPSQTAGNATLTAGTTTTAFVPRFSNGANTVMLLVPAAAPVSAADARMTFSLTTPGGIESGSRAMNAKPFEVILEEES